MLKIVRGNNKAIPDKVLLEKYKVSDDLELIGELYSRYMHLVYGVCLKYLKDRDQAQDGVMEIFEKLIIEFKLYAIKDIRSWLYVLTKNHCLMILRKKQADDKKIKEWFGNQHEFMESTVDLHPLDEERVSNEAALKNCMEKLKKEQEVCISLFYFENKSYREISEELNMDENKVKSHLQNAKRNLKICLEGFNVKR